MMVRSLAVGLIVLGLLGCGVVSEQVPHTWFAAEQGIVVGEPARQADGTWFLPLRFTEARLNSGRYLGEVEASVRDGVVELRAWALLVDGSTPAVRATGVGLGRIAAGAYAVHYVDPDGTSIALGAITIAGP